MPKRSLPRAKSRGFTLIEILVVFSIIAILTILGFMSWKAQIDKANDARRKADLERLRIAFEDFYNDYNCYPPAGVLDPDFLDNCGGGDLKPYLDKIPCDPVTRKPYVFQLIGECHKYRILGTLSYKSDPVIAKLGCNGTNGCGFGPEYNYGIASPNLLVGNPSPSPAASSQPSFSPQPGKYGCTEIRRCEEVASPEKCPFTFSDLIECQNFCVTAPPEQLCDP